MISRRVGKVRKDCHPPTDAATQEVELNVNEKYFHVRWIHALETMQHALSVVGS